jgi:PAS domain S-box-containing protein
LERLAGISLADVLGKTDSEWNPNKAEAEAFSEADRRVLDSGIADDREESFTGANGELRHYRSLRSPLRDSKGKVIGTVGVATDITAHHEAEQRERLLTRELDHRAKNLLSVVQSVVTLTRAGTAPEFKQAVEGRIHALGRAHSMLAASRWEGADLHRIVSEELAPYASGGPDRVLVEGPPLVLRPTTAQSLALVMHELATNAAKYGALSTDGGRLEVSWDVGSTPAGTSALDVTWTERGGPPVSPRTERSRSGFGTRLLRGSIERQLGGSLDLAWPPEGLVARIQIPLERTLAPQPPHPAEPGMKPDPGSAPVPPRRHGPRRAA